MFISKKKSGLRLKRLEYGIDTIGGDIQYNNKNLTFAVHPYFQKNPKISYKQGIDELIKNWTGPIIIFEEKDNILNTLDYFGALGVKSNRFFILSENESKLPTKMSPENLISILKRWSRGNPIELVGGYFWNLNENYSKWRGCLGSIAKELKEKKIPIKIIEDLVF